MNAATKQRNALQVRLNVWNAMKEVGTRGPNTKLVHWSETTAAFHKPGSQNRKKGASAHRSIKY